MISNNQKTDWQIVFIATLAGIIAATQIGKVPPAIAEIRADLNLSLVTVGWVVSVFNLMAGTMAIAIGVMSDRLDIRKVIAAGITMLLLGAIAGGFTEDGFSLIAARIVAGLGLVSIAVAAPRMIVGASNPKDFGITLGFWSIYMPTGIALGMLLTPLLLANFDWRQTWFVNGGMLLIFLLMFLRVVRGHKPVVSNRETHWNDIRKVTHVPGPWLLAGVFACYTIPYFAMMSWFPFFLIETQGTDALTAGAFGALVVAANIIGNLGAVGLMQHGMQRWILQLFAFVGMSVCALGVFSSMVGPDWKVLLAFIFSAVGGIIPSTILSASALHAPISEQVSTVSGVIVQGANLGSLIGPPLMAVVVGISGGWLGVWWLTFIFATFGILLVIKLRMIEMSLN